MYTPPSKSLSDMARELVEANALLSQLNKKAADQKEIVDNMKSEIINKMNSEKLKSANVDGVRLTVAKHTVPDVQDWDKLYEYIYAHKAFDMLHKRVTISALEDRIESEGPIEGVRLINQPILKVSK